MRAPAGREAQTSNWGWWNASRARLRCFSCEREAWLDGFTVSDIDPVKLVAGALIDQSSKAPETQSAGDGCITTRSDFVNRFQMGAAHRLAGGLSKRGSRFARLAFFSAALDALTCPSEFDVAGTSHQSGGAPQQAHWSGSASCAGVLRH